MNSIRKWIEAENFDYKSGKVIIQFEYEYDAGEQYKTSCNGWRSPEGSYRVEDYINDPIFNKTFDSGYGAPECPRFIAEDKDKLYFPWQYDGATGLQVVYKDITKYLDIKNSTPYPGC